MTKFPAIASLLALTVASAPADAADVRGAAFGNSREGAASAPFLFTGATLRLGFDGHTSRTPELALRMSDARASAGNAMQIGEGIALSSSIGSKPRLSIAGQDSRVLTRRMEMSGGTTALVIGGVVVAALVVAVASANFDAAAAAFENN